MKKDSSTQIFAEYERKWNLTPEAVRLIFILLDANHRKYIRASKTLASFGFEIKPRALRYFYRKIYLTDYYGTKKQLSSNYRVLVLRKS